MLAFVVFAIAIFMPCLQNCWFYKFTNNQKLPSKSTEQECINILL